MDRDISSGLFWSGIGIFFCAGALKYGLFVDGLPGPGLLPFIAGSCLFLLSLSVFLSALRKRKLQSAPIMENFSPEKGSLRKVLSVSLALGGYVLLLEPLGFPLTLLIFMIFLLRYIEPQNWRTVILVATLSVVACFILFNIVLQVRMPRGIIGL